MRKNTLLFRFKYLFCLLGLLLATYSCMSLVKADKLVYAGSLGKKIDAAIIDSISNVNVSNDTK